MFRKKINFILLTLFILLNVSTAFLPIMGSEITIIADEWIPYNGDSNSKKPGYIIEISKRIFEEYGHSIIYKVIPWKRAIIETRKGKYNAIIGAAKDEAADFIFPDEEVGFSENGFFVKKGNIWKYKGIESLLGLEIGLIKGYSYGKKLDAFFEKNKKNCQYVFGRDPLYKNIKKLLSGRIDILVEDPNVLFQKALTMNLSDQIVKLDNIDYIDGIKIYIAFSPKLEESKEYAKIFSEGIKKLKDSGELDIILEKYGLKYWK